MNPDFALLESDQSHVKIRIELVGRTVDHENCASFEEFLQSKALPKIVDVTGWTRYAIAALLKVCRREGKIIGLQSGTSYLTPLIHSDGPLLNQLIDAILEKQLDS